MKRHNFCVWLIGWTSFCVIGSGAVFTPVAYSQQIAQKATVAYLTVRLDDIDWVDVGLKYHDGTTNGDRLLLVAAFGGAHIVSAGNWEPEPGAALPYAVEQVHLKGYLLQEGLQRSDFWRLLEHCERLALIAQAKSDRYMMQIRFDLASATDAVIANGPNKNLVVNATPSSTALCKLYRE